MSNPRDDLRSTEESIRRDAERVKALEDEKAALDPADPRVEHLSEEIERLATVLQGKTAAERELVEEVRSGSRAH
jgi:hypothetical protein